VFSQAIVYPNNKRLLYAVDKFVPEVNALAVPIKGTLVQTSKGSRCSAGTVALSMMTMGGPTLALLVNNQNLSGMSGSDKAETAKVLASRDSFFMQLVSLLQMKNEASGNPFVLECASTGCTLRISSGEAGGKLVYEVLTPGGDAFVTSDLPRAELLSGCKGVRAFQYAMRSDTFDKEMCVRRGKIEIFKEIAHYLNRCLVFYELDDAGLLLRVSCLTHNGCCEFYNSSVGQRVKKVAYPKFKIEHAMFLGALDLTVDAILRAGSIAKALQG